MAKSVKLNFTVPEDVARDLKNQVARSKRSSFVVAAVQTRLEELKQEKLHRELVEGYQARCQEDSVINQEWENATLEQWETERK